MTPAGDRSRRIGFYSVSAVRDGHGVETETFALAQEAFALVMFGKGAERRDAAAAGAMMTATFRVLSTSVLRTATERWQIEYDGQRWGISSIAAVGLQGEELEFTATRLGKG